MYVSVHSIKIFSIWPHANRHTYIHTHGSSNAVMLVWGSLRLAPNILNACKPKNKNGGGLGTRLPLTLLSLPFPIKALPPYMCILTTGL